MSYLLSPFTDFILRLFHVGPFWALQIAELIITLGLILFLTDKAGLIGIIKAVAGAGNVSVSVGLSRKAGLVLILAGLTVSAAAIDGIASSPSTFITYGAGGPSLYHCGDFFNIVCWTGGSGTTGILTQVQTGSTSCTIPNTNALCASTVTFSPAYSTSPTVLAPVLTSAVALTGTIGQDVHIFSQEVTPTYATEVFDKSVVTNDVLKTASPMTFTLAVTPAQAGEFAVVYVYMDDSLSFQAGANTVTVADTQGAVWFQTLPVTADGFFGASAQSVFTAKLPTTAADTITVTITDPNPPIADYVGGTVELFQGVEAAATPVVSTAGSGGTADSVTLTPAFANDFIVGGIQLDLVLGGSAACDAITLSAPTTTRQTDGNCAANKAINFASGDQHPATATSQTFAATFADPSASDGDTISAMDLIPAFTNNGVWDIGTTLIELFNSTDHEISYTIPASVANGGVTTTTLHYTCVAQDNPSATLSIYLFGGSTSSGGTGINCNGQDQVGPSIGTWTASSGAQTFKVKGQCTSHCPDQIILSSLYFTVSYRYNQLPTIRVSSVTATAVIFGVSLLTSVSSATIVSWTWTAGIPV